MSGLSRFALALEHGHAVLPDDGPIVAYQPPTDERFVGVDQARLTIIHPMRPEHDHFERMGFNVMPRAEGTFSGAVVFLPRAKALGQAMLADAMARTDGGPILVDGAKTSGIEPMLKSLRKMGAEVGPAFSKAHGKLASVAGGNLSEWKAATHQAGSFQTAAGAFSAGEVDPASAQLATALPQTLSGHAADLGAGWGFLSHALLQNPKISQCDLIEADFNALEAARANIDDPRATFHWADALSFGPAKSYDLVLTNPPFHTGRSAEPALGQAFVASAARLLKPHGQLWLVANRHLPYESTLRDRFKLVEEVAGDTKFKIFRAAKPASR